MCYKGSEIEYKKERDKDIMRAYRERLLANPLLIEKSMWKEIADSPSKRFWVSPEQAYIIISRMIKGENIKTKNKARREMYEEILLRVKEKMKNGISTREAVERTIYENAPCFYLSPSYIRLRIYTKKPEYYQDKRKKFSFIPSSSTLNELKKE